MVGGFLCLIRLYLCWWVVFRIEVWVLRAFMFGLGLLFVVGLWLYAS